MSVLGRGCIGSRASPTSPSSTCASPAASSPRCRSRGSRRSSCAARSSSAARRCWSTTTPRTSRRSRSSTTAWTSRTPRRSASSSSRTAPATSSRRRSTTREPLVRRGDATSSSASRPAGRPITDGAAGLAVVASLEAAEHSLRHDGGMRADRHDRRRRPVARAAAAMTPRERARTGERAPATSPSAPGCDLQPPCVVGKAPRGAAEGELPLASARGAVDPPIHDHLRRQHHRRPAADRPGRLDPRGQRHRRRRLDRHQRGARVRQPHRQPGAHPLAAASSRW